MNSGVVPHTEVCLVLILTECLECEWGKKWKEKSDPLRMVLMGSCTLLVLFWIKKCQTLLWGPEQHRRLVGLVSEHVAGRAAPRRTLCWSPGNSGGHAFILCLTEAIRQ